MLTEISFLVTMDPPEQCPIVGTGRRFDWQLPDPVEQSIQRVRAIRDEIRALVDDLVRVSRWAYNE
jgi:hypothetical protein